jgi:outer membrane protein assembly factor BamB/tetratricopeptide (TPR) repeat protein
MLRSIVTAILFAVPVQAAIASDIHVKFDEGVVCLDEATGTPLWEYFPDEIAYLRLAVYNERLLIQSWGGRVVNRNPYAPSVPKVTALDPATGQVLQEPTKTLNEQFDTLTRVARSAVTASGDRVVGRPGIDRAITILKGDGPAVRLVIPADNYFYNLVVHRDQILYAPQYMPNIDAPGPAVVSVDANTGKTIWTIDDTERVLGISSGDDRIYVFEPEGLRAIDPRTGRSIWRQRLPRVQGWSRASENGVKLIVECDSHGGDSSKAFLYCLDAPTGIVLWTFDPQLHRSLLPLVFDEGRVFTLIAPSRLSRELMKSSKCPTYVPRNRDEPAVREPACLKERFDQNTVDEIELNLRAWHALGDRSLIPMLRSATVVVADSELRGLPDELILTFPRIRNPIGLIAYLDGRFAETPDLGPEVRRILEDFDPRPFWMRTSTINPPPVLRPPVFEPEPSERALMNAFDALKSKVDAVPTTRITQTAIYELMLNKGTASLASLVEAHDASEDPDRRMMIRFALYTQHPREASDWALNLLDEISPTEIIQWVQRAPIDWLLEHDELYRGWLRHENRSVRSFSAGRLNRTDRFDLVVPYCVRILEQGLRQVTERDIEAMECCMWALGKTDDATHVALLRRFVDFQGQGYLARSLGANVEGEGSRRLYDAAVRALHELGIKVPPGDRIKELSRISEPASPAKSLYERVNKLVRQLERAEWKDQHAEAKRLANDIIFLLQENPAEFSERDKTLATAYATLAQWDLSIKYMLAYYVRNPEYGHRTMIRLYREAGRVEDLESVADQTRDEEIKAMAGVALLRLNRLDRAERILSRLLASNPNSADACAGLARIHFKRAEFDKADALMDRAISLRPSPSFSSAFEETIVYWLDRGQPDRARAWVRESVRVDRFQWENDGLFDWAVQFDELKETVEELRNSQVKKREE